MRPLLALAFALALIAQPAAAQETHCPPGQIPRYVHGFADLKAHVGAAMGESLNCEFPDPNGTGDVHQVTEEGLAFWRKNTNTPTFTNGWEHWAIPEAGLVYWLESSIDPTVDAVLVRPPTASPTAPQPAPAPAPAPVPAPAPAPDVYYANCTAAREAGAAPLFRGQPGYRPALDRDNDGIACE